MSRHDSPLSSQLEQLRSIPLWTRRYAQNRPAGFLLFMVVFLLLFVAMGGSAHWTGTAYRSGHTALAVVGLAGMILSLLFCFWFAMPWWGGKWLERMASRYYAEEGEAVLVPSPTRKDKAVGMVAGVLYGVAILASIWLSAHGVVPDRMMQPVSALYVVPFLLFLGFKLHRQAGWVPLLWPTLYAAHAVLLVLGAPILFTGEWQALNMVIPIAGYGLLTGLVGHFYGRYALARLRKAAGEGK